MNNISKIFKEAFQIFLVTYLFLMILELIFEGFVSNYFNLNILLMLLTALGVALAATD